MTATKSKAYKEDFAKFFEAPTREGLRDVLRNNIGETRNCDFKAEWPGHDSLSKHILGIANTGGGAIIVGVTEEKDKTLEAVGLSNLTDKADIANGIRKYLPASLESDIDVLDFAYSASEYPQIVGKKFQVLIVPNNPEHMPYLSQRAGSDIEDNAVYIRKEGSTNRASHDELQQVLNRRIETGYSTRKELDLKEHLAQLKILIEQIEYVEGSFLVPQLLGGLFRTRNKDLDETYREFVTRMVSKKKQRIERELDV